MKKNEPVRLEDKSKNVIDISNYPMKKNGCFRHPSFTLKRMNINKEQN